MAAMTVTTPAIAGAPFRMPSARRARAARVAAPRAVRVMASMPEQRPARATSVAEPKPFAGKGAIDFESMLFGDMGESTSATPTLFSNAALLYALAYTPAEGTGGSLAVTLGLFIMSAPGLWSLVKRSTKSKATRKTYEIPGPEEPGGKPLDQTARDIAAYFKSNNYVIAGTGDVITFEGKIKPSTGTAAYITFCVVLGLASTALVLQTAFPALGNWWYSICLVSPAAWVYYMGGGDRIEQVQVKMVTSDDAKTTDISLEGDKEELERFCETLKLTPKGMVRVEGILSQ